MTMPEAGGGAIARLHVLSDLHLAPADGPCVFRAHAPLAALLDRLAEAPAPQGLVLNGDVFDFLQIPGYDTLSLPLAARRMDAILDALEQEPPARNVVAALRRFTARGHRLYCLPGNHDPELHLDTVQRVLQTRLGSRPAAEIADDDDRWRLQVGDRTVLGAHGHAADGFNAISGARMRQAERAGDDTVPLPPGSRLVCKVINPYRRASDRGAARFPFVDVLPSDLAVVLALLLLDPVLALRRLQDALGIVGAALVRGTMLKAAPGAVRLGPETAARSAEASPESLWLDALADSLAQAVRGEGAAPVSERLGRELQAYFDGHAPTAPPANDAPLLAGGGPVRSLLLRALAREAAKGSNAFRPEVADALTERSVAMWDGDAAVIVTGHTHAAKQIATPRGNTYLNTGTWLDLTPIPNWENTDAVAAWLDALARDAVTRWQGCPVAQVDADGARLLHWTGSDFLPWSEGLPAAG